MRRLVALAALAGCAARAPAPDVVADDEPVGTFDQALVFSTAPLERPFHYAARRDARRVDLLGTVHHGIEPARLPASVWAALDAAPVFAMEIDLDRWPALASRRPAGITLAEELGPTYWAKLEATVGAREARRMSRLKTSLVAIDLSDLEGPFTESMDETLRARAEARGARIAFLEEASLHVELLDRWFDIRLLKARLDDLDQVIAAHFAVLAAYVRGDDAWLVEMRSDQAWLLAAGYAPEELAERDQEILIDRNLAWIPQIEALAADGDLFVAFGCNHLWGPGGVLALLEERGWTIERVAP